MFHSIRTLCVSPLTPSTHQSLTPCQEVIGGPPLELQPSIDVHTQVLAAVVKHLARKKTAQNALQNEAVLAEKAEATNKRAQLISGSLTKDVPTWATTLHATDWETGETLVLTRDAKFESFQEECKKLFALSRRMKRGSQVVHDLLNVNKASVQSLEVIVAALKEGADPLSWKEELLNLGLREADFHAPVLKVQEPALPVKPRTPFRMFNGSDGSTILIGRNSRENDQLSTKVAKDHDVWMHSRATPGAHVIVRAPANNTEPSREALQLAANLAIFYSEARTNKKALVLVAKARHVIKFRGAPMGAVRVREEEPSMFGFPENVPEECVLARESFSTTNPTKRKNTNQRPKRQRKS